MRKPMFLAVVFAFSLLSTIVSVLVGPAAYAEDFEPPAVFQAAGPEADSIQGAVNAFRAALGNDNGNVATSFATGRREIN